MKSQTYMDRALKSRDPRYARILGKMGYARSDMVADTVRAAPAAKADDLTALRAEYQTKVGKRPFNGWNAETLREKIAAATSGD